MIGPFLSGKNGCLVVNVLVGDFKLYLSKSLLSNVEKLFGVAFDYTIFESRKAAIGLMLVGSDCLN